MRPLHLTVARRNHIAVIPANAGIQADMSERKSIIRQSDMGGEIPWTLGSLIGSGFRHSPE